MLRPYFFHPQKPNPEPLLRSGLARSGESGRRHLRRDLLSVPEPRIYAPPAPGCCTRRASFVREPSSRVDRVLPTERWGGNLQSMTRFRVRRGAVVAVLLVLAFAVAAALGVQAYGTARYHRAQADRVLRDYAKLAASRVALQSARGIYFAVVPPLKALQHAQERAPHKPLPEPKDLHFDTMEHEFSLAPYIRFTFRMDLKTGALTTSGQTLPKRVRHWLVDTLPPHTRAVYDTSWHMGTVLGQSEERR